MQEPQRPEVTRAGILTTLGAVAGLALGPSVIAVLTISAYIQPIEKEFGWSRVQVSLAFTLVAYMIVLVSPLQGWFVDRYGPRRTVLTSIPLFGLSLAALYFTPNNLYMYYLLWALVPVLGLGLWPLGYLQSVSCWFDRRLGFALGCANAGIGLGSWCISCCANQPQPKRQSSTPVQPRQWGCPLQSCQNTVPSLCSTLHSSCWDLLPPAWSANRYRC